MTSSKNHSPKGPNPPDETAVDKPTLHAPPPRPTLTSPPQRPAAPAAPAAEASTAKAAASKSEDAAAQPTETPSKTDSPDTAADEAAIARVQPIAPPSEPMQYRAIGLVKGQYTPSEEQFNRGSLLTEDGVTIEAFLLGRVTSLVKKHIDLETPHLWVVYPRTRISFDEETSDEPDLHLQIVGIWEPETLGLPGEEPDHEADDEAATDQVADAETGAEMDSPAADQETAPAAQAQANVSVDIPPVDENYFSIRGEVIDYNEDKGLITVKILQGIKRPGTTSKSFKLNVQGTLEGRTVGYFWDLNVQREAKLLVLQSGKAVGIVPPKKRTGSKGRFKGKGGGGGYRREGGKRPFKPRTGGSERPRTAGVRSHAPRPKTQNS